MVIFLTTHLNENFKIEKIKRDLNWQPEIGDPTLLGWITVVAYFVSAILCGMAVRSARARSDDSRASTKFEAGFWTASMVIVASLGINKQLDIQTLFTETARELALVGGWYDNVGAVGVQA